MLSSKNGFLLLHRYRSAAMGFAALWIFVFHLWLPVFGRYPKLSMIENFLQRIGFCGVDIFLFLSGIGMVYSIDKSRNLLLFYYKRVKRILFPFLLVAALRCALEHWPAAEFWKNISGVNFYLRDIYSFLWFVPMIVTFYILFPLYYRVFTRASDKFIFTGSVLMVWLAWTLYVRGALREDLFGFTNRIPVFITGILLGWLSKNKEIIFDKLTWAFLALMCFLGLYLSYLSNFTGMYILVPVSNCCIPDILIAVSLPFLIAGALYLLGEWAPARFVGKTVAGVLSFYGIFTFEFYCIQEWLGGYIISKLRERYSFWKINIVVLIGITAAALVVYLISRGFWIGVEREAEGIKSVLFPAENEEKKEKGLP